MIDVKTPDSAGWWADRLSLALADPTRVRRLDRLDAWYRGDPPLPEGAEAWRPAFRAFQQHSRTNFAELIVESCRERMTPRGIRTSSDGDATGDAEAWRIWQRAYMSLVEPATHRLMLRFGESFVLAHPVDDETGVPVVTAEDPRFVVSEQDPMRPWRTVAALKVFRDPIRGRDLAYLYRPGRLDVAFLEVSRTPGSPTRFSDAWAWDEDLSMDLPKGLMPMVRFENHEGAAEFEKHIDLLCLINQEILRRMVITQLQAFRQRGMKGLPSKDEKGAPIDYTGMFEADPGSLWAIPPEVDVWESQTVDITPILIGVRDDIRRLAAVTRVTVHTLDPSGENQSAEGAANSKESQTFKVMDRIALVNPRWSEVVKDCFLWIADAAEDQSRREAALKRADLNGIGLLWDKPDKPSLSERASAAAQAKAAGVPWRTIMIEIMDFPPDQVDRMESEREDDLLFAQRLALLKAQALPPAQDAPRSAGGAPPIPGAQADQAA